LRDRPAAIFVEVGGALAAATGARFAGGAGTVPGACVGEGAALAEAALAAAARAGSAVAAGGVGFGSGQPRSERLRAERSEQRRKDAMARAYPSAGGAAR
jgi:hypothetical protein